VAAVGRPEPAHGTPGWGQLACSAPRSGSRRAASLRLTATLPSGGVPRDRAAVPPAAAAPAAVLALAGAMGRAGAGTLSRAGLATRPRVSRSRVISASRAARTGVMTFMAAWTASSSSPGKPQRRKLRHSARRIRSGVTVSRSAGTRALAPPCMPRAPALPPGETLPGTVWLGAEVPGTGVPGVAGWVMAGRPGVRGHRAGDARAWQRHSRWLLRHREWASTGRDGHPSGAPAVRPGILVWSFLGASA
jgi:hypothetical protein